MSVEVKNFGSDAAPALGAKPAVKGMYWVVTFLRAFFIVAASVCLVAMVMLCPSLDEDKSSLFVFAQWASSFVVYAAMLSLIRRFYCDMKTNQGRFFSMQVVRLRVIAVLFLVLALLGLAFSFAAASIAHGDLPALTVAVGPPGFPAPDVWRAAFGTSTAVSVPAIASLDATSLVAAGLLWSLSQVFRYGAWLQNETDETI